MTEKKVNDWCKGIELEGDETSGCTCDCPSCEETVTKLRGADTVIVTKEREGLALQRRLDGVLDGLRGILTKLNDEDGYDLEEACENIEAIIANAEPKADKRLKSRLDIVHARAYAKMSKPKVEGTGTDGEAPAAWDDDPDHPVCEGCGNRFDPDASDFEMPEGVELVNLCNPCAYKFIDTNADRIELQAPTSEPSQEEMDRDLTDQDHID